MQIKNIVFDIGNVLVKWAPHEAIQAVLPEHDPITLYKNMFPIWLDLNLGKLTEQAAIDLYHQHLTVPQKQVAELMQLLKTSQTPIPGSLELLHKLQAASIPLYAITDNIKEFIEYHRVQSHFLHYFKGVVVSADIGVLKPNKEIYNHLLKQYQLHPAECVFIDDIRENVEGACAVGMHAFQFTDAKTCELRLREIGIYL